MNYLEEYKELIKDWFSLKRDPEATLHELDELNDKINKLWKKLTIVEQYEGNNYALHIKRF